MPVEGPSSLLHTVSFDWFDALTNQGSGNGLRVLVNQRDTAPTYAAMEGPAAGGLR